MDSNTDSLILNVFKSDQSPVKKKNKKNINKIKATDEKQSFGDSDRNDRIFAKNQEREERDDSEPRRPPPKYSGHNRRDRDNDRHKKEKFSYAKLNSRLFDETSDQRPNFTL